MPAQFTEVLNRLKEDDSILVLADDEQLSIGFTKAMERKPERLTPRGITARVAHFVHALEEKAERLQNEQHFPDTRNPNSCFRFRQDGKVTAAFRDDTPVWYWKRKKRDGRWKLYRLGVSVEKADWLDSIDEEDENDSDDAATRLDPERLAPGDLLGVVAYFFQALRSASERLRNEPYLPDTADPNGDYRFKQGEDLMVAYRAAVRSGEQGFDPAWFWKKKPCGRWRLFRLTAHREWDDALSMLDDL